MRSCPNVFFASVALAALFVLPPSSAFAAGSGGDGNGNTGSSSGSGNSTSEQTSPKKFKCKRGEIVVTVREGGKEVKKCVKRTSGLISDEELYAQGSALAEEGEYEWAIDILSLIAKQDDPKVLNYIGYSHRKAGRLETGIAFYRKALELNPDFIQAREYLGEGYVAAGRIDLARLELDEIARRCGVTCPEYVELSEAIASASN